MALMAVAIVLVGLVAVTNLVLTVGVIRRLREHTELLGGMGSLDGRTMLGPGRRVEEFTATTLDGETVTRDALDPPALVGFLSLGCQPCIEKLPVFAQRAGSHPGGRAHVLAVVVGDDDEGDVASFVDTLRPVARVVRQKPDGSLATAFGVTGYPAFALLGTDGVIAASGTAIPDLTEETVGA